MKEIKKYIIGDNGRIHNVETGEWFDDENVELVKYSDVEQLQARIKELESDAHINEIKAQGIDEFIKNCPPYERNMGALDDGTMVTWHCYNIHHLTNYIEKLRVKHD